MENLINKLEKIKVFENWEITSNEYEELFNEIIDIQRKTCISEKKIETLVTLKFELFISYKNRKNFEV